jgi:hypothetical protein
MVREMIRTNERSGGRTDSILVRNTSAWRLLAPYVNEAARAQLEREFNARGFMRVPVSEITL